VEDRWRVWRRGSGRWLARAEEAQLVEEAGPGARSDAGARGQGRRGEEERQHASRRGGGEEECRRTWMREVGRTDGGEEGGSRSEEARWRAKRGAARCARGAPIAGRRRCVEVGAGGDAAREEEMRRGGAGWRTPAAVRAEEGDGGGEPYFGSLTTSRASERKIC
jgi:hypothetical protein